MRLQRRLAYLLFVVSILMLGVPVVPHHHHAGGQLCMKNDLGETCTDARPNSNNAKHCDGEHCCCHTGCPATHFFQQRPTVDTGWLQPAQAGDACFLPALLTLADRLSALASPRGNPTYYYIESLHGRHVAQAQGLRAPPAPGA